MATTPPMTAERSWRCAGERRRRGWEGPGWPGLGPGRVAEGSEGRHFGGGCGGGAPRQLQRLGSGGGGGGGVVDGPADGARKGAERKKWAGRRPAARPRREQQLR
eukprot:365069-Chlamydomonas_euryale.AAC.16